MEIEGTEISPGEFTISSTYTIKIDSVVWLTDWFNDIKNMRRFSISDFLHPYSLIKALGTQSFRVFTKNICFKLTPDTLTTLL